MPLFDELKNKVQSLLGSWASISALGSFVLYLFGYLALRFHLTTLGIGTDLAVLDERYLFTGAKFLIYLVCTIPILILIALVPLSLVGVPYLIIRAIRRYRKPESAEVESEVVVEQTAGPTSKIRRFAQSFVTSLKEPRVLAFLSLLLSVVLIQFVIRQCFLFSNLLLAKALPKPFYLHKLFFDESGGIRQLYFAALVFGTLLTGSLLGAAITSTRQAAHRVLIFAAGLLVAIQFLLLPVNYGVFILEKEVPLVSDLGDQVVLNPNQEAWLVWEGKDGVTFLVRTNKADRKLVTVLRKDVKRTEILRYDEIVKFLFDP